MRVRTIFYRLRRFLLLRNSYRIDGTKGRPLENDRGLLRDICDRTKLWSDPSVRETQMHAISYPMNPIIAQPVLSRAGTTQLRRDYAIFKSFYYVVRLDYTYVLCIVSKLLM